MKIKLFWTFVCVILFTYFNSIYQYYKQYDLAIDSYKNALLAEKTTKTEILLGKSYILNKEFENAKTTSFSSIIPKSP